MQYIAKLPYICRCLHIPTIYPTASSIYRHCTKLYPNIPMLACPWWWHGSGAVIGACCFIGCMCILIYNKDWVFIMSISYFQSQFIVKDDKWLLMCNNLVAIADSYLLFWPLSSLSTDGERPAPNQRTGINLLYSSIFHWINDRCITCHICLCIPVRMKCYDVWFIDFINNASMPLVHDYIFISKCGWKEKALCIGYQILIFYKCSFV